MLILHECFYQSFFTFFSHIMVKRKGAVWKHWIIINENNNTIHPSVRCNYCSKTFDRGIPSRMQTHLDNICLGAPNNAKTKSKITLESSNSTQLPTTSTPIPIVNTQIKRLKTTKIDKYIDHMSEEQQNNLEILLAQALFAAGVPFTFLENDYVIQFFQQLRPAFKLPNRKKLADELLDEVFDEVKAECDNQISKAKSLTMVSDSWSNINRESVQNFIICTPKPLFFDAIYSSEESHTAEWIANQIIQQMNIIDINKFSAVITDTTNVIKIAW